MTAHDSWTGNLVTNATWEHFWLNEGWTVWLERKIMSRVKGEEFLKLSSQEGWWKLKESCEALHDGPFTALVWPLKGEDPDDAFSSVPYEKGFNLLYMLEQTVRPPRHLLNYPAHPVDSYSSLTSHNPPGPLAYYHR